MSTPIARTPEDLERADRWLLPILQAALDNGWSFEVTAAQHGHRDVTFTRRRDTVRIRGLRRAVRMSRWVVDGIDFADLFLRDAPAALADPDRFLHPVESTDGAS